MDTNKKAELVEIIGSPLRELYNNNNFKVLLISCPDGDIKKISGTDLDLDFKKTYTFKGEYSPKYPDSLSVQSYNIYLTDDKAISKYLQEIPTIGKVTADKIIAELGQDCIKKIKENKNILKKKKML